jgi:putative hydrolase of the HAD superfamily
MGYNKHHISIIRKNASPLKPVPTDLRQSGSLRRPVRALLFDLYGTLFMSGSGDIATSEDVAISQERVKRDRLEALLRRYDLDYDPERVQERYSAAIRDEHERLRGKGVDYPEVVIERIWKGVLGFDSDERARTFSVEYESMFNPVWPMPHASTLLTAVRDQELYMGIVSNAQFFTPLLFETFMGASALELGFTEELALYSYVYGFAKPSTFLFERARDKLLKRGIDASEALFVGNDMLNDVYTAQRVGFQTVLFAGDKRSLRLRSDDVRCNKLKPDLTINDLLQLSEVLGIQKA